MNPVLHALTRRLLAALATAIGLCACEPSAPPPPQQPAPRVRRVRVPTSGTVAMARRLEKAATEWENLPYEPKRQQQLFAASPPSWMAAIRRELAQTKKARDVMRLRHRLARELLRAGESREALRHLEWLFEVVESSPLAAPARAQLQLGILKDTATACLRAAEQENCLAMHNAESCLFPILPGGVHQSPGGARMAVNVLTDLQQRRPNDLGSRWLLNLACMTLGEYPEKVPEPWLIPPRTFASDREFPRYRNIAHEAGVAVVGLAGGCCVDDFDGDGDLDIVASSYGVRDQLVFLRQVAPRKFRDDTTAAGLTGQVGGLNICHADFDNDGALDVLVLRGGWLGDNGRHPNSLLRNLGGGVFDDVTQKAGLLSAHPTQTAAWSDFDNDGWLDVFIGNESNSPGTRPSQLFHNNGDGTFTDCAAPSGLAEMGFVKGVCWGDFNNDGFADLYVSRINSPNRLFRNGGKPRAARGAPDSFAWTFADVTRAAGVAEPLHSFPAWFWDYDNDGWPDIFAGGFDGATIDKVAADYLGQPHRRGHPRLYRNQRDGTFRDVTRELKLDRVLLAMGANYGDVDGDGFQDLYIGTGTPSLRALMPNRMFRNNSAKEFQDVTTAGGFGHLQKGHGIAFADIDNDGDQDVYAVMGGWFPGDVFANVLFENPGNGNHWLTLKLTGTTSNTSAIGARIRVDLRSAAGAHSLHRTVATGGSFGSTTLRQEIGLGRATAVERVEIRWPSGKRHVVEKPVMDQTLEIIEDAGG